MKKIQYPAKIEGGILKVTHRKNFDAEIGCQLDCFVRVTVEKARKIRSTAQNRYWWGVVIVKVHEGFCNNGWEEYELDAIDVHEYIKHTFCKTDMVNKTTGEVLPTVKGTSKMTTTEFIDLIAVVQRWCLEFFKIKIPDPNQQEFTDYEIIDIDE